MKQFIRVMKALPDPNRVRVLKLLQDKELCVCNIQDFLQLAQSTVSRHMKVLEDAGLVERRRQGTWIIYRLAKNSELEYEAAMLSHLAHWLEDDKDLKQMRIQRDLRKNRDHNQQGDSFPKKHILRSAQLSSSVGTFFTVISSPSLIFSPTPF